MPKQQFKIIVTQDENGYFVASVPALPGCHTQAKDLAQLKKRAREAISLCLEVAKKIFHINNESKIALSSRLLSALIQWKCDPLTDI